MAAAVHYCGMFSPVHISLNMSVRKVITFFPQYLSSYVGIPSCPGVFFLYFKALFTPSSLNTTSFLSATFCIGSDSTYSIQFFL